MLRAAGEVGNGSDVGRGVEDGDAAEILLIAFEAAYGTLGSSLAATYSRIAGAVVGVNFAVIALESSRSCVFSLSSTKLAALKAELGWRGLPHLFERGLLRRL